MPPKIPDRGFTLTFPHIDEDPNNPPLVVDVDLSAFVGAGTTVSWGSITGVPRAQLDLNGGTVGVAIRQPTEFDPLTGRLTVAITDKVKQGEGTPGAQQDAIISTPVIPILPGLGNIPGPGGTPVVVGHASTLPQWPTADTDYVVSAIYDYSANSVIMDWKEIV